MKFEDTVVASLQEISPETIVQVYSMMLGCHGGQITAPITTVVPSQTIGFRIDPSSLQTGMDPTTVQVLSTVG
jgi:hypothetical protein